MRFQLTTGVAGKKPKLKGHGVKPPLQWGPAHLKHGMLILNRTSVQMNSTSTGLSSCMSLQATLAAAGMLDSPLNFKRQRFNEPGQPLLVEARPGWHRLHMVFLHAGPDRFPLLLRLVSLYISPSVRNVGCSTRAVVVVGRRRRRRRCRRRRRPREEAGSRGAGEVHGHKRFDDGPRRHVLL